MNAALLDQIVNAVLYEGYILYPYRPSSAKNCRERFTFGRVYPEAYSQAQQGAEPWVMQTECLVEAGEPKAEVEISVRFLHPMAREIEVPDEPGFRLVPELRVDGQLYQTWHEAVEREVRLPGSLGASRQSPRSAGILARSNARSATDCRGIKAPRLHGQAAGWKARAPGGAAGMRPGSLPLDAEPIRVAFGFPGTKTTEPLRNRHGQVAGRLVRRQEAVAGTVEVGTEALGGGLHKVTVRIFNQTAVAEAELQDPAAILMRTLASTHTILHVRNGAFISLTAPPGQYQPAAQECQNLGTWPVLVGDEARQERDTLLSSPIILSDYPQIAPESAGTLFDGTEIDELLTLRILTMTDQEKLEMRRVDEQARRLLERTEALPEAALLSMHGVMRSLAGGGQPNQNRQPGPAEEKSREVEFDDFFGPSTRLQGVMVAGVYLQAGDRVRIRPKARADAIDLALAGQTAVIEAVEQDLERRIHLALVVENDPGKDLGLLRQPGHRFFYGVDEVEPLR